MLRRKFEQSRYFEDFTLGRPFTSPRAPLAMRRSAFRAASGDNHPLHYDMEYAKERGFPAFSCTPADAALHHPRRLGLLLPDRGYAGDLRGPVLTFCETCVPGRYALPQLTVSALSRARRGRVTLATALQKPPGGAGDGRGYDLPSEASPRRLNSKNSRTPNLEITP